MASWTAAARASSEMPPTDGDDVAELATTSFAVAATGEAPLASDLVVFFAAEAGAGAGAAAARGAATGAALATRSATGLGEVAVAAMTGAVAAT